MEINLISVKNDANNRFQDIDCMFTILKNNPKTNEQIILKSSVMIMLYNAIEGIFSNLLTEFFDIMKQKKIQIDILPQKLQNTIFTYHLKKIGQNHKELQRFSQYDSQKLCCLSYLEINNYLNLFSGNLDGKSIKATSDKLGVDLPNKLQEPALFEIKIYRQKLAHGEKRFSNTCQDITSQELNDIYQKVKTYLTELILIYESSLNRILGS